MKKLQLQQDFNKYLPVIIKQDPELLTAVNWRRGELDAKLVPSAQVSCPEQLEPEQSLPGLLSRPNLCGIFHSQSYVNFEKASAFEL